ncbi:regulatory protein GemA [Pseudoalteromonas luteoviolacea]|uniref:regulatory protein GemA n=1 Tax=Pseudoalteromonas luteoviolacea TaxID=43657 RepID=UPI001154BC54|nr:regulatory protein GemA [Pseudoalteromonas luteoviolacea]TQF71770.1 regulatory protein GemA [Pseudoalteromonas luteoviolacea]
MNRNAYYGLIHKGAQTLLGLNQMLKAEADETYRNWLYEKTRKRSCKECTDWQLRALKDELERKGALPKRAATAQQSRPAPSQPKCTRAPTERQYKKLIAVVKSKGWSGLGSEYLKGFIRRTTGVESVYQLDRRQMSNVITGLEKWHAS